MANVNTSGVSQRIKRTRERLAAITAEMDAANGKADDAGGHTEETRAAFKLLETRFEETKSDLDLEERLAERMGFRPEAFTAAGRQPEETSEANPADVYRSFGDFLVDVHRKAVGLPPLNERAISGLNETVGSEGGFLVGHDFGGTLIESLYSGGTILNAVSGRKITISAQSNGVKFNMIDETSRATGSRFGGVQVYWGAEGYSPTAKKPKTREVSLELKKCVGLCYTTEELLQDAAAVESVVAQAFEEEMRFAVEDAIFRGLGTGQPLGFTTTVGSTTPFVSVAAESAQTAATVVAANVAKMYAALPPRSMGSAIWLVNQAVIPQLYLMTVGQQPVWMPPGGMTSAPGGLLMGRPVYPVEYCEALGTLGDIVLFDPLQYLFATKTDIQRTTSMHVRFVEGEMAYRFVWRVDGQPAWRSAVTPYKGAQSISPYVGLATRS